jgi:GAF domain-containing protein/HAMP domain-containing protein/NADH:ubiquinone oxidoreductase subunit K
MTAINQSLQYLAWLIALVQFIIGLYLIYLDPRRVSNRLVGMTLLILALNTFAVGLMATAQDSRQASLPALLLAATTAAVVPALLLASFALLQPTALRQRGYSILARSLALIGLMPPGLTLIDALLGTRLWYTGPAAIAYRGGYVFPLHLTQGWISPILITLIFGGAGLALLSLLAYTALSARQVSRQNRATAFWLLLANLFPAALVALPLQPQAALALHLAASALYLLAYALAAFSVALLPQLIPSPAFRQGRLQRRLTMLALIVALPLLAGLGAFLTQQAQIVLAQDAARALSATNRSVAEAAEVWLAYNTRALRTLVGSPDIISMDPARQTPALRALVSTYPDLYLASTTDKSGMNIARSDSLPPANYSDRAWFQGAVGGQPITYQTLVGSAGQPALVIAMPIRQPGGLVLGVGMAASDLRLVSRILGQAVLNTEATAYLINSEDQILAISGPPVGILMEDISNYPPVKHLRSGQTGDYAFTDVNDIGWRASLNLLSNGWGVAVQQTEASLFAPVRNFQRISLIVLLVGGALLFWLTWLTVRQVMQPVRSLTETAAAITAGDLNQIAPIYSEDELGLLAHSFNTMTAQLRDLVGSLERRVSERTRDLQRRAVQLQVTAQVAREAASIRDLDRLLQNAVRLISEQFNFYHAGIFLLDRSLPAPGAAAAGSADRPVYAVLRAASSEGGRRMLARGHRLRVGQQGIVGYVAGTGEPRIALDTDKDAVYFDNPDLPMTRSEMALPLKIGKRVIGVLDVQSRQANAFNQEDLETLQILADQLAIAIDNARLLAESQEALRELENLYSMQIRQGWQRALSAMRARGGRLGYALGPRGIQPLEEADGAPAEAAATAEDTSSAPELIAPIELRNQKLGLLRLRREAQLGEWTEQDQALIDEVLSQLALALENARLLEEIRNRARQEELINQIVTSAQGSLSLEGAMRTAVQEVVRLLNVSRVRIRLTDEKNGDGGGHGATE